MLKKACTNNQIIERKKEIIQVTNKMLDEMDYQNISMKSISERISIARSSLYCYYKTKEEIILDVLKDDYLSFLNALIESFDHFHDVELCKAITNVYMSHYRLLEMISVHLIDIENHCTVERLIEFKKPFVLVFKKLHQSITQAFPNKTKQEIEVIMNSLLMLTQSLYPMTKMTPKQIEAMNVVGMNTNINEEKYCFNYISLIINK